MITLANLPLFASLPAEELEYLSRVTTVRRAPAGAQLLQEGSESGHFFIILEGRVQIIKALDTEEESILAVREAGEFIGEMGLLNQSGQRTASVRALDDVRLLVVPFEVFNSLLSRRPQLALELASVLSARMTSSQDETILTLRQKNQDLQAAYDELREAQAQIIQKEKLERELELAHDIQCSILPGKLPQMAGYDFGALMTPARAVGGDFFGIFPLDEQRMVLIVGDVTDKGVPAALFMAQSYALLRASASAELSPVQVLEKVNTYLLEMNSRNLFATVIYGVLYRESGEFVYGRAGHELPLLLDGQGHSQEVELGEGIPLGIMSSPMVSENRLTIPPGGLLFLYTDGVTDCISESGKRYSEAEMVSVLQSMNDQPAQEVCDKLEEELMQYQGGAPQFDDITLLAVRRQ